jgi:hypothetical protein
MNLIYFSVTFITELTISLIYHPIGGLTWKNLAIFLEELFQRLLAFTAKCFLQDPLWKGESLYRCFVSGLWVGTGKLRDILTADPALVWFCSLTSSFHAIPQPAKFSALSVPVTTPQLNAQENGLVVYSLCQSTDDLTKAVISRIRTCILPISLWYAFRPSLGVFILNDSSSSSQARGLGAGGRSFGITLYTFQDLCNEPI